ncbi:MAG: glycine--tRNA ligase subunit beta, partial [Sphaerochaeta sp.]
MNKALFEIGVEDLPSSEFDSIVEQLDSNLRESLKKSNITFDKLEIFITPRRFGAYIEGLPLKQEDQKEERKGPPKSICFDKQNQPTKALEGFAKSVGVSIEDIQFKSFNGQDYAYVELVKIGESTKKVLENIIPEVITKMTFKKPMRWGTGEYAFVRPIHWVLALYNDEIISFEIFGKKSSNISFGHRFFGDKITVNTINTFFEQLRNQYVLPFYEERIQKIKKEIKTLEIENKISVSIEEHEDLVQEIAKMTEYPTAVLGSFNEKNLFLPSEIVTVTIKHHQRSFVASKEDKLLNLYISFQDGFGREQNVVAGYTRVINARLDDAAFYFEDDMKAEIEDRLEELSEITYQRELGSYREKVERISIIS